MVCVCPWRTRLRGWQALGALAEELLPAPVLDAVLPPVVRRQAAADYERWLSRNPDARPWIRTATWQVPVRWFVLVRPTRSGSTTRARRPTGRRRPCCATARPMVQARRRVARGLRTLRETLDEGPLIDGLVDVGRWLEEFHPRSLVELDYGGLVHALIGRSSSPGDHSAADVAEGIAALRDGDGEAAGRGVRAARGPVAGGAGPAVRPTDTSGCGSQKAR